MGVLTEFVQSQEQKQKVSVRFETFFNRRKMLLEQMRNEDCGSEENDSEQKRSKEPNVKLRARSDPGTYNLVAASKRS